MAKNDPSKRRLKLVKTSSGYRDAKTGKKIIVAGPNRTHCNQGHKMTRENTYLQKDGVKRCWTCRRTYDRKRGGSSVRALPQKALARIEAAKAFPVRQECEVEGCDNLGVRHHDDYNKPLEIRWLCYLHHGEEHSWSQPPPDRERELVLA